MLVGGDYREGEAIRYNIPDDGTTAGTALVVHSVVSLSYCRDGGIKCTFLSLTAQSEGKVQKEAMYINKSLTFLEQIVIALAEKNRDHVPFRQSKLTHCLKDSIGGASNTLLIANIWGEPAQIEETVSECSAGR